MSSFVEQEFINWKSDIDGIEKDKLQHEIINIRYRTNDHVDGGGYYVNQPYNYYYTPRSTTNNGFYEPRNYYYVPYYRQRISYTEQVHYDRAGFRTSYIISYMVYKTVYYQGTSYSDYHSNNWFYKHSDIYRPRHSCYYSQHSDRPAHSDYYHSDTPAHYDCTHSDTPAHYDNASHSDYYVQRYSYYNHRDIGFDHNDFVPSKANLFTEDLEADIPMIKGITVLGFHSYDKNIDGFGSQDDRSKVVYYDVKIRQIKDLDGSAKTSGWKDLLTNTTNDTYELNTIDPLGTGNLNSELTDGYYEIQVNARNATQTIRGVSQSYESQVLTKEVKIQQNLDPELTISNHTKFISFTFGLDNVLTPDGASLYNYQDYADEYNIEKYNGLLVNMIVVEKDEGQWLKGEGWLEDEDGEEILETRQDIIWENGEQTIETDGISDYNANLFISKDKLRNLNSGHYKIVVQIEDFLDSTCSKKAGALIKQSTISKTDDTQLVIGVDMVVPTVAYTIPDSEWIQHPIIKATVNDDFIGVSKWRYREIINNNLGEWSDYLTSESLIISTSKISGYHEVEAEVIDKVGNIHIGKSEKYKRVAVENFNINNWDIDSLGVNWKLENTQQYQTWLVDEEGYEMPNSRSQWLDDNSYVFKDLDLMPNTKYVPRIITKLKNTIFNDSGHFTVENLNKAYTNAEHVTSGRFKSGDTNIEVTLNANLTKNSIYTQYIIKNDNTGSEKIVSHNSPIWNDINLNINSFYTYLTRPINKNNNESNWVKLMFTNGDKAHTNDTNKPINEDLDNPVNLDELIDWDESKPVLFDPTNLDERGAIIDGKHFIITRNVKETISNDLDNSHIKYSYSKDGFEYTDFVNFKDDNLDIDVYFNEPGYYLTEIIYKGFGHTSKAKETNYLVNWISPKVEFKALTTNQMIATKNTFSAKVSAKSTTSPYLFYSSDNGSSWYVLKGDYSIASFYNIQKSNEGKLNNVTIKVVDVCGNLVEKTMVIWGVNE